MDGGHSAHVHTLRLWQRDRPVDTDENRFRNSFPLFVAQRRLTPLVISSILPSPSSRAYATFIALVSAPTPAKLHYLFTGH